MDGKSGKRIYSDSESPASTSDVRNDFLGREGKRGLSPCSPGTERGSLAGGNLWLLPSFLCLDAPLVALAWAYLLHRDISADVPGFGVRGLALFSCVWGIYLVDRMFDARGGKKAVPPTLRHRFASRHRALFAGLATAVAGFGVVFVVPRLSVGIFAPGVALLTGCLLYFLLFRVPAFRRGVSLLPRAPWKEAMIAACFTLGVFLAAGKWPTSPGELLLASALAGAFLLNCLLIALAEEKADAKGDPLAFFGSKKNASRTGPTGRDRRLLAFGAGGVLFFIALYVGLYGASGPALAIAASASGLACLLPLTRSHPHLVEASSDAVILIPPVIFLFVG